MLLFPVIPVGLSTEHKNFCGSVTVRPDTYYHLLYDICVSLAHHGFKKLAFLVCHGGNAPIAQVLSRELRSELGIAPFILSVGAFGHPDVKATISKGVSAFTLKRYVSKVVRLPFSESIVSSVINLHSFSTSIKASRRSL